MSNKFDDPTLDLLREIADLKRRLDLIESLESAGASTVETALHYLDGMVDFVSETPAIVNTDKTLCTINVPADTVIPGKFARLTIRGRYINSSGGNANIEYAIKIGASVRKEIVWDYPLAAGNKADFEAVILLWARESYSVGTNDFDMDVATMHLVTNSLNAAISHEPIFVHHANGLDSGATDIAGAFDIVLVGRSATLTASFFVYEAILEGITV